MGCSKHGTVRKMGHHQAYSCIIRPMPNENCIYRAIYAFFIWHMPFPWPRQNNSNDLVDITSRHVAMISKYMEFNQSL